MVSGTRALPGTRQTWTRQNDQGTPDVGHAPAADKKTLFDAVKNNGIPVIFLFQAYETLSIDQRTTMDTQKQVWPRRHERIERFAQHRDTSAMVDTQIPMLGTDVVDVINPEQIKIASLPVDQRFQPMDAFHVLQPSWSSRSRLLLSALMINRIGMGRPTRYRSA